MREVGLCKRISNQQYLNNCLSKLCILITAVIAFEIMYLLAVWSEA
jgi:hypothetical protein